jgi:hypothetical protein
MAYFQAIPLYLRSDTGASEYFQKFRAEADAISGSFPILVPTEVDEGNASGVTTIFANGKARYTGLQRMMLPCLWVEDGSGGHTVIRLEQQTESIQRVLGALTDGAKTASTVAELGRFVNDQLRKDAVARNPELNALNRSLAMPTQAYYVVAGVCAVLFLAAIFAAGVYYPGAATEKAIAVVCGVIFIAVMLLIAVFIPSPTTSQERTFRVVLALASAGFVSMTPGFLNVEINTWIKAGGALAVFVLTFFYSPGSLAAGQHK